MNVRMTKVKVSLLLGLAAAFITTNYNNCAQHKSYQLSNDAVQKRLSEGSGIFINEDATYTNSKVVSLYLENNSAKEMYITNSPDCDGGGQWEPYSQSKVWTLKQSNSEAKVFAKFREDSNSEVVSFCASDSIIHDDIAPELTVLQAAPKITKSSTIQILLKATDSLSGVAGLTCKDGKGVLIPNCREGLVLKSVTEGPGSVQVKAIDAAGNSSLPVIQTWLSDYTAPSVSFNSTPSNPTNLKASVFAFSGNDNFDSTPNYTCSLDGGPFAACSSPATYNLNEGSHSFSIKAKDDAGNISAPITYAWNIDLSAPTVQITSMPSAFSNSKTGAFAFEGFDEGVALTKFECKINSGTYTSCTSGYTTPNLADGSHIFSVRGYDGANNVSAPATYTWIIDTTKPVVQITSHPAAYTAETAAVFQFSTSDTGSGFASSVCSLDGSSFQTCSNSASYQNLAEGNHSFRVQATDKSGNTSDIKEYKWFVDLTAPTIKFLSTPQKMTKVQMAEFLLEAKDNSGKAPIVQCKLNMQTNFDVCTTHEILQMTEDGVHSFSARSMDEAGNISTAINYSWTLDTQGPSINFTQIPLSEVSIVEIVKVAFNVTDAFSAISSIECGPDGSETSCSESTNESFNNLGAGSYKYTVKAVDALGNSSMNSITWSVLNNIRAATQDIVINQNNKADILIIIDNSGSMAPEQQNMASRFSTFIDKLNGLDWRVAIVTTDVSANAIKKDGRLLEFTGLANQYYIHSGMNLATAKKAFADTIKRPESGSGAEQGIAASYRTLQRSQDAASVTVSAPNKAFFRSDAVLSMIVVTDSDETNNAGTQVQNKPETLINYIKTLWPAKPFVFNSIVVKSGDSACKASANNETYGVSYENLSRLTSGEIGSVCAADYSAQLQKMGQAVVDLVKTVNLSCRPVDKNRNGNVMDDIQVTLSTGGAAPSHTVDGLVLNLNDMLPAGTHRLDYWCLQ